MVAPPLTLQEAISDSPIFRANLRLFEDQVDDLEKYLNALNSALKEYNADLTSKCSVVDRIYANPVKSTTSRLVPWPKKRCLLHLLISSLVSLLHSPQ